MLKKVLVLDKGGMAPSLAKGLESELKCSVEVIRDGSFARAYLDANEICLAIVNPYFEQGGVIYAYVDFIKNDLSKKVIPILVFSRVSLEKIAEKAKLRFGKDYQAYLRKPAQLDEFIESINAININ